MKKSFLLWSLVSIVALIIVGGIVLARTVHPFKKSLSTPLSDTASTTPVATTTMTTATTSEPVKVAPVKKPTVTTITRTTTTVTTSVKPTTGITTTVTPTPTGPAITTVPYTITNTVRVSNIPLLAGGDAHIGSTVPVSYLQVINQGSTTIAVKGFYMKQVGTAPDAAIIGFNTVDDKGSSRASISAAEGVGVLKNGVGYAPSTALIAPGQMKLFTIKASISTSAQFIGKTLGLEVTGVDEPLPVTGAMPIYGATWTIIQ